MPSLELYARETYAVKSCNVGGAAEIHDLFFKFTGCSGMLFEFNSRKFAGNQPFRNIWRALWSGEEEINAIDFVFMKKYLLGVIDKFPAGM